MHHPYINGYNVLPNLLKFNGSIFSNDQYLIEQKKEAIKNQNVFFEHNIDHAIYVPICNYIAKSANLKLDTFNNLAIQLSEDILIHRIINNTDWLAACHVCFPSGWLPEDKIGKSFEDIHLPIPGMNLKSSFKIVQSIINHGPFLRYVWSPVYENKINFHPSLPKSKFNGEVYVKVEEQITVGFPEIQSVLFVLRQNLIQPQEINYMALYKSCKNMTFDQKKYKNVSEELIKFLETKILHE